MNRFTISTLFTLVLLLSLGSTGCNRKPKALTPIPGQGTTVGSRGVGPGPVIAPGPGISGFDNGGPGISTTDLPDDGGLDHLNPNREALAEYTIYFDFDRSNVRPDQQSKLEEVAAVLRRQPNTKLQVEGHCDERGTEEYNRSLGERRALEIRSGLISLGVGGDRIFTISYGEDKPAVPGHDESAYARNRRGEFVLYVP